jgi:hypothetical protein
VCDIAIQLGVVLLLAAVRGITKTGYAALSRTNSFRNIDKSSSEASTPTGGGDVFWYGVCRESQVRLIGVEHHLRGATIGGKPSRTRGGYLQRSPLVGLSDFQYP